MARLSQSVTLVEARLRLVTSGVKEFVAAQRDSIRIATQTGQGYGDVVNLYSRLSLALDGVQNRQQRVSTLTSSVANALRVSGASAAEASSVITQFGQAMGSGVLRGEEFNAIMENGQRLAKALADGLGLPVGKLRALAEQGLLTAEVVERAIASQAKTLAREAATMPRTIEQAMTNATDAVARALNELDKQWHVTSGVVSGIDSLADNAGTAVRSLAAAIQSALIPATIALATKGLLLAQSISAQITQRVRERIAERQAYAARLQSLRASVEYTRLKLAEAEATVASATGMRRLALVEQTLIPAQERLRAAQRSLNATMAAAPSLIGGIRGALSLLGGPIGLITTLLTFGITAWASWGNEAESAAEKAKRRVNEVNDALDRLERRKKFGTGDAALFREELNRQYARLSALRESAAVTYRGRPTETLKRQIAETERRIDRLRNALASLDAERRKLESVGTGKNGGPTALGQEILRKQWDAYIKRFAQGREKLKVEMDKLRQMARQAGIKETSDEFKRAAEALRRKVIGEQEAKAKKDALNARRSALAAELNLLQDGLQRQSTTLESALKDRLISIKNYYRRKAELEQRAIDAEIANTRKRLEIATQTGDKQAVVQLETELIRLSRERESIAIRASREQAKAERELADALANVRDELARLTGMSTATQRREAIARGYRDLRARLLAENDTAGVSLVDRLIDVKAAQANLDALESKWRLALDRMRNAEESIHIQQQQGLITNAEAQDRIAAAHRQAADVLRSLLPSMEQAANAIGPEAVARVQAWKNELASVQTVIDPIAQTLNTDFKNAFTEAFTAIGSGAKNAKQAFLDFARSIVASIQRILAQKLSEQILGSFFKGSGGAGGFIAGLLKGFATGGYVTGPGTSTSDSIPARLSAGEYVINAAAVKRVGVAFLHAINNSGFASSGPSLAFAAGGLVPSQKPAAPQSGQGVRILNVIDPNLVHDYIASAEGEKVIINHIERNAGRVRQVLGG